MHRTEASRIFAEIILSKVDLNARRNLDAKSPPIHHGVDYECRRYVDNYYVFTNVTKTAEHVEHELSIALREYNLHYTLTRENSKGGPFIPRNRSQLTKSTRHLAYTGRDYLKM